jgi:hypothetical protein
LSRFRQCQVGAPRLAMGRKVIITRPCIFSVHTSTR